MLVMPPDIFPLILLIDVLDLLGDAGALGLGPGKKNFVLEYDNDVMYDNIIEKNFSKLEKTIEIKYHNTLLLNLKFSVNMKFFHAIAQICISPCNPHPLPCTNPTYLR